jgi:hypothetical protein
MSVAEQEKVHHYTIAPAELTGPQQATDTTLTNTNKTVPIEFVK